jgi:hypothetical protein
MSNRTPGVLMVMSNLEDAVLSEVQRTFYSKPSDEYYLQLTSWLDADALYGTIQQTMSRHLGWVYGSVRQLDIVGHAKRDSAANGFGIVMGRTNEIGFGISNGKMVGEEPLQRLLACCTDDCDFRLIFCNNGDDTSHAGDFIKVFGTVVRAKKKSARVSYTEGPVGLEHFGAGGYHGPLVSDQPNTARLRQSRQSAGGSRS